MKRFLVAALVCVSMGAQPTSAREFDAETGLIHMRARDYDPSTGRFLQEDPIMQTGESPFTYARNNPLIFTDPLGLRTEVVVWEGVGLGTSFFGHMSIDINGTTYSFGPGTRSGNSTIGKFARDDYFARNSFRAGTGLELLVSADQEQVLQAYLEGYTKPYSFPFNACTAPPRQALQELGLQTGTVLSPGWLGLRLINMGLVSKRTLYPAVITPEKQNAAWTK